MNKSVKLSDFSYKDEISSQKSIEKLDSLHLRPDLKVEIAKQLYLKSYLKFQNTVNESLKTQYFRAASHFLQYIHSMGEVLFLGESPKKDFAFFKFFVEKRKTMDPVTQDICNYLNEMLTDNSYENYKMLINIRENMESDPSKYEDIEGLFLPILEEYIEAEKSCLYDNISQELGDINEEFEFYVRGLSEAKKPAKKSDKKPAKKATKKKSKKDSDYEKPDYKQSPDGSYPGPYGAPARRFLAKGDVLARMKKNYGKDWQKVYYSVARKVYGNWHGRGKTELPRSKWYRAKDGTYYSKKHKPEETNRANLASKKLRSGKKKAK